MTSDFAALSRALWLKYECTPDRLCDIVQGVDDDEDKIGLWAAAYYSEVVYADERSYPHEDYTETTGYVVNPDKPDTNYIVLVLRPMYASDGPTHCCRGAGDESEDTTYMHEYVMKHFINKVCAECNRQFYHHTWTHCRECHPRFPHTTEHVVPRLVIHRKKG